VPVLRRRPRGRPSINGAHRWFIVGPASLFELAKPVLPVRRRYLAALSADVERAAGATAAQHRLLRLIVVEPDPTTITIEG
jgi:hypothetical protein